jgi:hypothetical protein
MIKLQKFPYISIFLIFTIILLSGITFGVGNAKNKNTIDVTNNLTNELIQSKSRESIESKSKILTDQIIKHEKDSIKVINSGNEFNKFGIGNNSLVTLSESLSYQQITPKTNSISFNSSSITTNEIIPSLSGYNLNEGYFNITNVKSVSGEKTIEGSSIYTSLNSITTSYNAIASSFVVDQEKVNITTFTYYLDESGATGGITKQYNIKILNIESDTRAPNGTIIYEKTNIPFSLSQNTQGYKTLTLISNNTFSKGEYCFIIEIEPSLNFFWQIIRDDSLGDGVNESFLWTKAGQNWNLTEYNGDLPLSYSYTILNTTDLTKEKSFNNPESINFKINNFVSTNFSNALYFNDLSNQTFNFTTNLSVSFDINFYLKFKSNIQKIPISYNISNSITYWILNYQLNPLNSLSSRNITFSNIPANWSFDNQILNNSVPIYSLEPIINQTENSFYFLNINGILQGNLGIIFSDSNYVESIKFLDTNLKSFDNFTLTGSNNFHFAGEMKFNPPDSNNLSLIIEKNSIQITNISNAYIHLNVFVFPLINISNYFDLNDSYQGTFKVIFSWSNENLTKIGYYEQFFHIVIQNNLDIEDIPLNYYVGELIAIKANFTDFFNNTVYSNASLSYSTDWGSYGNFTFNISSELFETNISTFDANNSDHKIIIYANNEYFVNQSIEITVNINTTRPTTFDILFKEGFINEYKNITRLSGDLFLNFNYNNSLNSSSIYDPDITFILNSKVPTLKINNSIILSNNPDNLINIKINLDPIFGWTIGNYNFTIVVDKFGFESKFYNLIFSIIGYDLKIDLSFNDQFIRNQDFHITAKVSFSNVINNAKLFKIGSFSIDDIYLFNISLKLEINLILINNSKSTILISDLTDQKGIANFELTADQTNELKSIQSISASFSGNSVNNPKSITISGLNIIESVQNILVTDFLLIIIIIFLVLLLLSASGYYIYKAYILEFTKKSQFYDNYINSVSNFLGMYITNKEGLPIFLKSNQQIEDQNQHLMLSGVTYSIDLFLNNFKEEYSKKILKEELETRSNNINLVNMTLINQENFKILIGVSHSYRMYVLIKESNETITRIFQNVLERIQKNIQIKRTIINLHDVYPLFQTEISKIYPIDLVNEFEIDFYKLVKTITNSEINKVLSNSTIAKLKELSFYLIRNSNLGSIKLDEDFDFHTIINNSKRIKVETLTLKMLINILKKLKCSKRELYEILFICAGNGLSIFRNITPISIPTTFDEMKEE